MGFRYRQALGLFLQQRRGNFVPTVVHKITEEDEPAVREWLTQRWQTMKAIWEPIV